MASMRNREKRIAQALGATTIIRLKGRRPAGPLGWLALAQALQHRLISRGGRPSDPAWDTRRLVPFRRSTWERLSREAERMSSAGRRIGPAQLAAFMIEQELGMRPAQPEV